ncbi:MAG: CopG family transcriptional regulator [Acidobacteriota bacterium]
MTMNLDPEIEHRLERLGATSPESKAALVRHALLRALEDLEDLQLAESALAEPGRRYTLDEVERELGLDG